MPEAGSIEGTYLTALEGWRFEDLPVAVVAHAKLALLDTLASAWAAQDASGMHAVLQLAGQDPTGIPLWGRRGHRAALVEAVFANAALAAALDYDSLHEAASVHPDAVAVPAALGAAQAAGRSGRDYILAYVKGAETLCRLGLVTTSRKGWFRSALYGPFAAALSAASALGLDRTQTRNALGIAYSFAGGTHQSSREFRLTKRLQSAFATRNGVFSAVLAQHGATGPFFPWSGELGLFTLYEAMEPTALLAGLGEEFTLLDTTVKRYPCCAASHGAIEAAFDLKEQHGLDIEALEEAEIRISPASYIFVGRPFTPEPDIEIGAQFCVAHGFASALLRGRYTREDLLPEQALDPALLALLPRIRVVSSSDLPETTGAAHILVKTKYGRRLEEHAAGLPGNTKGGAGRPFSPPTKWRTGFACGPVTLSDAEFGRLLVSIEQLENVHDVSQLFP